METTRPIAVKPFVQGIEEHCAKLDRSELIDTIVSIGPFLSEADSLFVAGRMPGFDDLSVGWFQGLEASGLEDDRTQRLYLEATAVDEASSASTGTMVIRKWLPLVRVSEELDTTAAGW